jgi:hypothetical protein
MLKKILLSYAMTRQVRHLLLMTGHNKPCALSTMIQYNQSLIFSFVCYNISYISKIYGKKKGNT